MSDCRGIYSELLPDYVRGLLEAQEMEKVTNHLKDCEQCALEANVIRQLASEDLPEPGPWFFASLPGKVTEEVSERKKKKRLVLVPVWAGGLVAAAMVLVMVQRPGPAPDQKLEYNDLSSVFVSGSYYLGLEEELIQVSGTVLDDLEKNFTQDLKNLPLEFITAMDLIPGGYEFDKMDDKTIRLFEELVEEMTPVEERKKVIS